MYKINLDIDKNLVEVELEGFWSASDFDLFIKNEYAALSQLKCQPGDHILLCDLTRLNVSAPEVAAYMGPDLNSQGSKDAKFIALVVSSMLLRMQLQRLITRDNIMFFEDIETARAWLLEQSGYG